MTLLRGQIGEGDRQPAVAGALQVSESDERRQRRHPRHRRPLTRSGPDRTELARRVRQDGGSGTDPDEHPSRRIARQCLRTADTQQRARLPRLGHPEADPDRAVRQQRIANDPGGPLRADDQVHAERPSPGREIREQRMQRRECLDHGRILIDDHDQARQPRTLRDVTHPGLSQRALASADLRAQGVQRTSRSGHIEIRDQADAVREVLEVGESGAALEVDEQDTQLFGAMMLDQGRHPGEQKLGLAGTGRPGDHRMRTVGDQIEFQRRLTAVPDADGDRQRCGIRSRHHCLEAAPVEFARQRRDQLTVGLRLPGEPLLRRSTGDQFQPDAGARMIGTGEHRNTRVIEFENALQRRRQARHRTREGDHGGGGESGRTDHSQRRPGSRSGCLGHRPEVGFIDAEREFRCRNAMRELDQVAPGHRANRGRRTDDADRDRTVVQHRPRLRRSGGGIHGLAEPKAEAAEAVPRGPVVSKARHYPHGRGMEFGEQASLLFRLKGTLGIASLIPQRSGTIIRAAPSPVLPCRVSEGGQAHDGCEQGEDDHGG